jgi:hypothetical protein
MIISFGFVIAHSEMHRYGGFVLGEILGVLYLGLAFFVRKVYYLIDGRLDGGEILGALEIPQ